MTAITSFQPSDLVSIHNGQAITTSIRVADVFGKLHKDVLRAIESLDCSDEFRERNFAPTEEILKNGAVKRKRRYYEMTRDGFVFLAMGFTGKKAARFKEAYINAFNAMERELRKIGERAKMGEATSGEALLPSEQQLLREIIARKVQASGLSYGTLYARLHAKFRISSYKQLPREKLAEAIHYIESIVVGKVEDKREETAPDDVLDAIYARARREAAAYAEDVARYLMDYVNRYGRKYSQIQLVRLIEGVEIPQKGKAIFIHHQHMWEITQAVNAADEILTRAKEAIVRIERRTGLTLMGR